MIRHFHHVPQKGCGGHDDATDERNKGEIILRGWGLSREIPIRLARTPAEFRGRKMQNKRGEATTGLLISSRTLGIRVMVVMRDFHMSCI